MEQFANGAVTTLASDINSTTPTIPLTDGSAFPSSGNFRLVIGSEIMLATARSSNTLTVTRHQEGTSAASHSAGDGVACILTAGAMTQFRADGAAVGAIGSVFSAGTAGRLYFASDAPYLAFDDGSSVNYFGPVYKMTPPVVGDFTWVNQGSATANNSNGGLYLNAPALSSDSLKILAKSYSAPKTVVVRLIPNINPSNYNQVGIGFRESATGKMKVVAISYSAGFQTDVAAWTNSTSFSADLITPIPIATTTMMPPWLKIVDDNTNLTFYYSLDGYNFKQLYQAARTAFFTSAPDQIMLYASSSNSSLAAAGLFLSWVES